MEKVDLRNSVYSLMDGETGDGGSFDHPESLISTRKSDFFNLLYQQKYAAS